MPVNKEPMVLSAYQALEESRVSEIVVVTGRDHAEVETLLSVAPPHKLVHNSDFNLGMTTSIQKGISEATGHAYMICMADMPWLGTHHYNVLLENFERVYSENKSGILIPKVNTTRGNPVIFSSHYRQQILNHREMTGCRQIVRENGQHLVEYTTDDHAFIKDVDTPEDYQALIS